MNNLWRKKEYGALGVVVLLFVFVSVLSLSSISLLQGNARVVNFVGIVRGATQKLVKEEIMGWYLSRNDQSFADHSTWYPDDELIERLDGLVGELLSGKGENSLVVLQDNDYLRDMRKVQAHWEVLKGLIEDVRAGEPPEKLFESSQNYFELVNKAVFSAEAYSERQVRNINRVLIGINLAFVVLIISGAAFYIRSLAVRRRADALGKIAYIDPLTELDNRASCERLVERIRLEHSDRDIAVIMFDMNDLKLTNDFLGHQGGDKIISGFAHVLKESVKGRGFVGRFGGDEFLAVLDPGDDAKASDFLSAVHIGVDEYNEMQINRLEKIHYAAGYVVENPSRQDIDDIIHDADNRMYEDKRRAKRKNQGATVL